MSRFQKSNQSAIEMDRFHEYLANDIEEASQEYDYFQNIQYDVNSNKWQSRRSLIQSARQGQQSITPFSQIDSAINMARP